MGLGSGFILMADTAEEEFDRVDIAASDMIQSRASQESEAQSESVRRATEYSDTIEAQIGALSDLERERYQERDDISSNQLREELENRESIYSAVAKEAGLQRVSYEDLTEAQREEYAARLRLGYNYESELRQILENTNTVPRSGKNVQLFL